MTNKLKTNAKVRRRIRMAPLGTILDKMKANEKGRRRIRMAPARAILDKLKANEKGRRRIRMAPARCTHPPGIFSPFCNTLQRRAFKPLEPSDADVASHTTSRKRE